MMIAGAIQSVLVGSTVIRSTLVHIIEINTIHVLDTSLIPFLEVFYSGCGNIYTAALGVPRKHS
jgi:hypothetical protein